ncbi:DEKNAAC101517 [Brettanomyces naardenensis]|uniref:Palmitoyltransferase n=1 Tax=Brettanomyces naardenensis TaxID=13370 RepID=A0A448YHX7_BRENA|nr:DEKNAAC101517 [Brettanomyces naardenensis]
MTVSFKWPWMGVAIPVIIIGYLHASTTLLLRYKSKAVGLEYELFQASLAMIWISYYLAIKVPPGTPPKGYKVDRSIKPPTFWYKYCLKCKADKPERCHHCKTCGRCVLKMDHHCPWTMNCVGYGNLPHFTRFLVWVLVGCGFGLKYYARALIGYYRIRNLPSYLINKYVLTILVVNSLLLLFVEFTILLLFLRTMDGLMSNVTTIEDWEKDRMHRVFLRDAFWTKVRDNYSLIHPGKPFPELTSWKINYRELPHNSSVPANFSFEDLVFPYDLGSGYENMVQALGPVYQWLWPWGGPEGDGLSFPKNWWNEEDELKIPFPIDGGDYGASKSGSEVKVVVDDDGETTLGNFPNELGETLDDFGVDLTTENYEMKKRV